jgi:hypothetical protein
MANPVPEEQAKRTFHTVFLFVVSCNLLMSYFWGTATFDKEGNFQNSSNFWTLLNQVASLVLTVWNIWALTKTRAHVRAKDQIPEEQCYGCEDLCCALFCSCCTVAQLYRHTEKKENDHRPVMPPSNTAVVIEAVGIV